MMKKMLKQIQKLIEELDYECTYVDKGEATPIDILLVSLDEENHGFAINILPLSDDLDGSYFVQFYYEYPVAISEDDFAKVNASIFEVNRQLPLGHFNFTISNIQVYYKYVSAMPNDKKPSAANIGDIVDMVIFSITHFKSKFIE